MIKGIKIAVFIIIASSFFVSCQKYKQRINSNQMFVINDESNFSFDSLTINPKTEYKVSPGDRFSFIFYTNSGERFLYNMSGAEGKTMQVNQMDQNRVRDYLVRLDGTTELPKVGVIKASGLTVVELTNKIVSILSKSYIDPFVQIRLTNQRVIVFTGIGKAQVVYLKNQNTTLLEALAMAGGIAEYSKSNNIRVMRKMKNNQREIYKIDLSTIKGVKEASMIVQSEDYIYVDYRPRVANRTIKEAGPWLQVFFSAFSLYAIIRTLTQ
ncbi:MAG: polysaccharide biosynthesis/export family protein [Crocinitomicaceae bacterium]|nr:polysaccharide biosynthesis/export family protein [Crocinitomicaceae bacterium]